MDYLSRRAEPRLPPPTVYSGEPLLCRSFLATCSLHIALQPSSFPTEDSKVAFVITLLTGRAALWGTTVWEQKHHCCFFIPVLLRGTQESVRSGGIWQGGGTGIGWVTSRNRSVTDYSIEFRTLAAECKWNYEAQWDMFRHGLADRIINEIYTHELPTSLDGLIDLAIRVDARLQRRGQRALQMPVVNTENRFSSMGTVGHVLILNPCKWAEPIFHGRRRRDAGIRDYVYTAVRLVILRRSAR